MLEEVANGPSVASLVLARDVMFVGVKVFSATVAGPREDLGELITNWTPPKRREA